MLFLITKMKPFLYRLGRVEIFVGGMFIGIILRHSLLLHSDLTSEGSKKVEDRHEIPFGKLPLDEDFYFDEPNPKNVQLLKETEYANHRQYIDLIEASRKVRVLCWVMTNPNNTETKAATIRATWGQRCDSLLFMSTKGNSSFPTIELDVPEGYEFLWAKTQAAFKYVYENHFYDADWFIKADDDTYVVVENLRYLLKDYSPDDPIYFGRRLIYKPILPYTYMSGGAGYVLSREALKRFVTVGLQNPSFCPPESDGPEDLLAGVCLEKCGVQAVDSRDEFGRHRFHPLPPYFHMVEGSVPDDFWLKEYDYHPSQKGPECCSDLAVSFHYIQPGEMYLMEYFLYRLKASIRTQELNHEQSKN